MLDRFFNFQENPFNLTPDPRFFYANPMFREAYGKLLDMLRDHKGYMVLTGETGAGKTTLLKTLLNDLGAGYRCVYFEYSNLTCDDFLGLACNKLGLKTEREPCRDVLKAFLIEQSQQGVTVAFIIDEAQNMPLASLAEILTFTSGLSEEESLVQIVLSGQPQLEAQLEQPQLLPLRERLYLHYRLSPLPGEEVDSFIRHRLSVAGNLSGDIITSGAIQQVTRHAQGRPRLINMLCSRALVTAYATSQKRVSAQVMMDAILDLREEQGDSANILQKPAERVEKKTAESAYGGPSQARLGHEVHVILPWKEEETEQEHPFRIYLSEGIKASHEALRLGLEKLSRLVSEQPIGLPWKKEAGDQTHRFKRSLSEGITRIRKTLHPGLEKLAGWISERPIGFGKGAAITALAWLLVYPILERKTDDVEAVGTGDTAAPKAVVVSDDEIAPFNSPPTTLEDTLATPVAEPARTVYATNLRGNVELIEAAAFEVVTEQITDSAVTWQEDLGSSLLENAPTQLAGFPDARVTAAADSEAKQRQLEKKLLTSEEKLAHVEEELARTRKDLSLAHSTIEGQKAQLKVYISRIGRLHDTTNELKYRMVSFPEHLALRDITKRKPPEPTEQPIPQDRPKVDIKPQKYGDPASPIDRLLARADELMKARHLTTPAGNNAFEIFRQVLKIAPDNKAGQNGIEQIKQQYLKWGARAQKKRDWLNAGNYYKKALAVDPLDHAAEAGLREVTEHAIRSDGKIGPKAVAKTTKREDAGQRLAQLGIPATPKALLLNAERGDIEAVRALLAAGISPDAKLSGGWTALMSAATHGHIGVVRTLLTQGADVNTKNDDGKTALTAAAWNGHTEVVKELLAGGAKINEQNKEGWTALMYAAWNGHRRVVETLLEGEARIGVKDANNWTALTAASSEGHVEIVKILETAGGS